VKADLQHAFRGSSQATRLNAIWLRLETRTLPISISTRTKASPLMDMGIRWCSDSFRTFTPLLVFCLPGEGRDPLQKWAPAFAGVTRLLVPTLTVAIQCHVDDSEHYDTAERLRHRFESVGRFVTLPRLEA
jgi:hypothetical protein